MPYSRNSELPPGVKNALPDNAQSIYRHTFNSEQKLGLSEERSHSAAWGAVQNAGYHKDKDGKWVKKAGPAMSDVHVDSPMGGKKKKPKKPMMDEESGEDMPDDEDMEDMHKAATKRENGKDFHAGDYAYVPDASMPSTWKLRLTNTPGGAPDPHIVGAAVAALGAGFRGNKVSLPAAARAAVIARVRRAWREAHAGMDAEMPDVLKAADDPVELIVDVKKVNPDQRLVFGWLSVVEEGGNAVVDLQDHVIEAAEIEAAAYDFMLNSRIAGEMHERIGVGHMVESMVFTKDKQDALGIDLGKVGWWVGFRVDQDVFDKVKSGELSAFSIGGKALLEDMLEAA